MTKRKQVVVTGAAQGIGKSIAERFAQQGHHVWLIDINEQKGKQTEELFLKEGLKVTFAAVDVTDPNEIERFLERVKKLGLTIKTLINNAGVSRFLPLDDLTLEEWELVMNTNVRSALLFSQGGSKVMEPGSSIINIASTRALMSEPGSEAYAASKGALLSLTHALASSLAPSGIRVNSVSPGWIQTENYEQLREGDHRQHWSGRVGKPDDIARTCLFLADESNDFITGENIVADGGMTRKMIYRD
ncbi:SDR family oxidoreductase [Salipaludibacillus sp. CUR1]|uniref:SDR family oxidoreductase n=1 Tax=Salipaludibacillus sp. CUR1 TaxID=2820003 RepID=UPI001E600216|nr:SDR family oxidoreductase [Salipaludibacillus sp. CUR1]MCE7794402.1 SDR family oxidoreductase [Salipaludibacillus sp. CUR1]